MINITQDIHSLTEFKKNTNNFIDELKKSGRPTILTVNGKAQLVVMDAAAYQKIQEKEETINEIKQSLQELEDGDFLQAKDVIKNLDLKAQKLIKTRKNTKN